MLLGDIRALALYPFTVSAAERVKETGITLEDLISSRALERARMRGKERIFQAIEGEIYRPRMKGNPARYGRTERARVEMELLSYPFARILVSCVNDAYLIRRYALMEGKSMYTSLVSEDDVFIMEMAEGMDVNLRYDGPDYRVFFADYVHMAVGIRASKWKLSNRDMNHGWVRTPKGDFTRLLQEAIYEKIQADLPLRIPKDVCKDIESYVEEVRSVLKEHRSSVQGGFDFGEVDAAEFPPCMKHLLENLKASINLPHTARFALTSFLLNIGMNADEIVAQYNVSPDFDEEKTRYQVEHIAGRASGTTYTPPACSTMNTYGNCHGKDRYCEKVSHPLGYYEWRMKIKKRRRGSTNSSGKSGGPKAEHSTGKR